MKKLSLRVFLGIVCLSAAVLACQAASNLVPAGAPTDIDQPAAPARSPATPSQPSPGQPTGLPVFEDSDATYRILTSGDATTLYQLKNEAGQDETFKPGVERYTVNMSSETQIDLGSGWCAKTAAIRDDNKSHFDPAVTVNDYLIPDRDLQYFEWQTDDGMFCFSWDIVASNWPAGEYDVREAYSFDTTVNDGWHDYAAGDYVTEYTVTVAQGPAASSGPTSGSDECISWDEVTVDMKGDTVCVRGVIVKFSQEYSNSRYYFTDERSTFFLFSALWEFYDADTGKTIAPGDCVEVISEVQVQSGIPFMNLDTLDTPGHEGDSFRGSAACD